MRLGTCPRCATSTSPSMRECSDRAGGVAQKDSVRAEQRRSGGYPPMGRGGCTLVQVTCDLHQQSVFVGEPNEGLAGNARGAHPNRELAPVTRLELYLGDVKAGLEELRQPGGAWVVVSDQTVANLDGLHDGPSSSTLYLRRTNLTARSAACRCIPRRSPHGASGQKLPNMGATVGTARWHAVCTRPMRRFRVPRATDRKWPSPTRWRVPWALTGSLRPGMACRGSMCVGMPAARCSGMSGPRH